MFSGILEYFPNSVKLTSGLIQSSKRDWHAAPTQEAGAH